MAKGQIDQIINISSVQKQTDTLIKLLDQIESRMMKMGSINVEIKNSKNIQEFVDAQKRFNTEQSEAIKLEKQKNVEIEKAWNLEQKRQQKLKESKEKQDLKDQEAAMKKLNAESEKRLRSIEKESAYLKKHGEEYVKLTRNVESLRVKTQELILTKGKENEITKQSQKEYDQAKQKLTNLQQTMGNHTQDVGRYGKVWDGLKGAFFAVSGAIAAAAGAIKIVKDAIASSEALTEKWEQTVMGAKEGYSALLRTIATGDWSNLFTNIDLAIKAGKEYAAILDEIEERTIAIQVTEAERRLEVNKQIKISKDQRLSDTERSEAAKKAYDIEKSILKDRDNISQTAFKNELQLAAAQTGLSEASIAQFIKQRNANNELVKGSEKYLELIKERDDLTASQIRTSAKSGMANSAESARLDEINRQLKTVNTTTRVYAETVVEKMGKIAPEQIEKIGNAYTEIYNTQNEFEQGTRRLWSSYTGFLKSMSDEEKKTAKESVKNSKVPELEKLDKALKDLMTTLDNQIVLGDEGYLRTAKEIQQLKDLKESYEKLRIAILGVVESREMGPLQTFQPKGTKGIIKYASDEKRMGAPIGNLTGPDITGGGIEEEKSPDEIALEKELKVWEQRLEMTSQFVSAINELVSSIYENEFQKIDEAAAKDEENRARELKLAGDNKKSQDQINAKYDQKEAEREKEKKKLKHDQAVYDKAISAVNIGINTAVAAMQAYAQLGPIAGTVAAILVIAFGAIQLAAVLATNIPSYEKGRKGGPEELAKVHRGEMIISDNKSFLTPDVAESLAILPAGADVIPASEVLKTAGRLATQPIRNEKSGITIKMEDKYGKEMLSEMKKEKPQTRIYTENGYTVRETGNYRLLTRV